MKRRFLLLCMVWGPLAAGVLALPGQALGQSRQSGKQTRSRSRTTTPTSTSQQKRNAILLDAIRREDLAGVRKAVQSGADLRAQEAAGQNRSALSLAAELGNKAIVRLLLDKGAPVNGYKWVHAIPLLGALNGLTTSHRSPAQMEIVRLLLERGADPNVGWEDQTAAESAITFNQPEVLQLLIRHGLNVNRWTRNEWSLLQFASSNGDLEEVKILLAAGADPNAPDRNGDTPLVRAKGEEIKAALRAAGGKESLIELPQEVDLSSPKAVIASFEKAINRADLRAMTICVSDGRPNDRPPFLKWLADAIKRDDLVVRFAATRIEERKGKPSNDRKARSDDPVDEFTTRFLEGDPEADTAICLVETTFETRDSKPFPSGNRFVEPVQMVKEAGRYRIVPYSFALGSEAVSFLNEMAARCADLHLKAERERRLSPLALVAAIECRVRMAVLARDLVEYAVKHGEKFPASLEPVLTEARTKYNPDIIGHCSMDGDGKPSHSFNARLSKRRLDSVKEPQYTILLYESRDGKPLFRHGGQIMVAFCGGRCGLLDPQTFRSQFRDPAGK